MWTDSSLHMLVLSLAPVSEIGLISMRVATDARRFVTAPDIPNRHRMRPQEVGVSYARVWLLTFAAGGGLP